MFSVTLQVVHCGRFWAQNGDADSVQLLNNIDTHLQQYVAHMQRTVCQCTYCVCY